MSIGRETAVAIGQVGSGVALAGVGAAYLLNRMLMNPTNQRRRNHHRHHEHRNHRRAAQRELTHISIHIPTVVSNATSTVPRHKREATAPRPTHL